MRALSWLWVPSLLARGHRSRLFSVIYVSDQAEAPTVRLFTKEGCTLCDKVKDVLATLRQDVPHNLEAVDITDEENTEWFEKYKYDIPVLHIEDKYWIKHRITPEEAKAGLLEAQEGTFQPRRGEPNAGKYEHK